MSHGWTGRSARDESLYVGVRSHRSDVGAPPDPGRFPTLGNHRIPPQYENLRCFAGNLFSPFAVSHDLPSDLCRRASSRLVPPPSSSSNGAEDSLFGQVAGEFSKRLARGESPEIDERLTRYPQIATWIRDVFPALQALHDPHDPAAVNGATHGRRRPWMELGEHQRLADFLILRELGRGRGTSEADRAKQMTERSRQTERSRRST